MRRVAEVQRGSACRQGVVERRQGAVAERLQHSPAEPGRDRAREEGEGERPLRGRHVTVGELRAGGSAEVEKRDHLQRVGLLRHGLRVLACRLDELFELRDGVWLVHQGYHVLRVLVGTGPTR